MKPSPRNGDVSPPEERAKTAPKNAPVSSNTEATQRKLAKAIMQRAVIFAAAAYITAAMQIVEAEFREKPKTKEVK